MATSFWGWLRPSSAMTSSMRPQTGPEVHRERELYRALDAYYRNVDLYNNLRALGIFGVLHEDVFKGLRNPTNRVVEFYAKKLWPGQVSEALSITGPTQAVIDTIQDRIWKESNFPAMKQVLAREAPLFGDFFAHVATRNGNPTDDSPLGPAKAVYIRRVDPMFVTDFEEDERKFAIRVRLDIPQESVVMDTALLRKTRTEVWDKVSYKQWVHFKGEYAPIDTLGPADIEIPLSVWGIDFVPFVRAPFRDIGDTRGVSAVQHAFDVIDDLNTSVTRLHALLFRSNKNTWVAESSSRDANGRLLAPINLDDWEEDDIERDGRTVIRLGDEEIIALPGGYTLNSRVPQLQYEAAISSIEKDMAELTDNLPEMAYYRTRDLGTQLSGVALRLILAPAIDNVIEARGNAYAALVRLNQMALTIGINTGVFERSLGTYEAGDFDHSFIDRPVIALTELEEAQVATQRQVAGVPRHQTLIEMGYTEDQVTRWETEANRATQQAADAAAERARIASAQGPPAQPAGDGTGAPPAQPPPPQGNPPGTPVGG